jgi:hypothetical protein
MDEATRAWLEGIASRDAEAQGAAYRALLEATERPVDWAYEAWGPLLAALGHKDNRTRSIASQVLCNLAARSDPEGRILRDFDALVEVTRDEKFVTARHCLLALWKVGGAGPRQRAMVVERLARRFADCAAEKNATLIRHDIVQGLRRLHDLEPGGDAALRDRVLTLIETEPDPKYRKKYAAAWRAG